MPDQPMPSNRSSSSLDLSFTVALLLALGLVGGGVWLGVRGQAVHQQSWSVLAVGVAAVAALMAAWPLARSLVMAQAAGVTSLQEKFVAISERLEQFSVILTVVSEQQLLSDRAKSVAFREKERDTLRRAIQEEIGHGNFEGATALANDIEASFGLKQEADRFRQDISARRADIVRRQINDAAAVIDRHCRAEQWQQASREAERLAQLFPADEQARNLPAEIEKRRETHKQNLIQAFHDARSRNDIDGSIEIVKQLDLYLSPAEAEAYQEQVRGVYKDKQASLRASFSLAVHDQHWPEATRLGEIIIRDFPNTQMAKEVREKMDALRERASTAIPAEPVRA